MEIRAYLEEFKSHLRPLPKAEQEEIYAYYEEFFLDSGKSVAEIKSEYGNPRNFARIIIADTLMNGDVMVVEKKMSKVSVAWMIILGILATPMILPFAVGMFALLIGVSATVASLAFSIYVGLFSFGIAGLVMFVSGISVVFTSFATGVFSMGMGLLLMGAFMILLRLANKFTAFLFRLFMNLLKWMGRLIMRKNKKGGMTNVK